MNIKDIEDEAPVENNGTGVDNTKNVETNEIDYSDLIDLGNFKPGRNKSIKL